MEVAFVPGIAELVMLFSMMGGFGLPVGIPPQPEDPILANVAPEECLLYVSWAGVAEPDPNSPNQTEQLLAEPEVQGLIREVDRLITVGFPEAARDEGGREAAAMARDAVRWGKTLLTHPAALFLSDLKIGPDGPKVQAAAVVNVGEDAAELKATLERYQSMLPGSATPVEIAEETWYRVTVAPEMPPITWGVKAGYFAVGVGDGVIESLLERAATEPPAWFSRIGQQLPIERRATVTYLNVEAIRKTLLPLVPVPMVGRVLDALGLNQVTSLICVTGLDQNGFVSKSLVGLEGEPQGLFRLAAAEPLGPDDLEPIPRDATVALAARVNLEEVLDTVLSIAGKIAPNAPEIVARQIGQLEEELDFDLRRDLLQALGDTWCVYNSPSEGGLVITGLTAVVQVKDRQRLASVHAKVLAALRAQLERRGGRRAPRFDQFQFAGQDVFVFNARDDDFFLAPSWCLTEDALVIAPFPQNIKAYLSRDETHESLAAIPEVAAAFEGGRGPLKLWYVDTRSIFELLYPFVPMIGQAALGELAREAKIDVSVSILPSAKSIGRHLRPCVGAVRLTEAGIEIVTRQTLPGGNAGSSVPIGAALLFPAVGSARQAARRAASVNNLKQIGLALHNYHDTYRGFPPAYTTDEDGKPLLSWRVHILPYIDEAPLYEQFHLDEPWDSEHNQRLIRVMPPAYRSPDSRAEPGKTNYLGVSGERGIFPGKDGIGIAAVKDGTSNTIMVVEVNDESAVIWTKPDDFVPDDQDSTEGLLGLRPGGFNALLTDGSARFLADTIDRTLLQALFTRDGGERVGAW